MPLGVSGPRENIFHSPGRMHSMSSTLTTSTGSRQPRTTLRFDDVGGLLDTLEEGLIVAERNGQLLLVNRQARRLFDWQDGVPPSSLNLFSDLLKVDGPQLFSKLEGAGHKIEFPLARGETKY